MREDTHTAADWLARSVATSFAQRVVSPDRAAELCQALPGVVFVSVAIPASCGTVVSIGNLATKGPTQYTLVSVRVAAAGPALEQGWSYSTSAFKHFSDISMFPDALKAESLICMPLRETPNVTMERIASMFVVEPAHGHHVDNEDHAGRDSRQGLEEGPWDSVTSCNFRETAICSGSRSLGALLLGFNCQGLLPKREVGELASMLGAHIAPLAQEAVNLVSAAYLARTLSSSSSCSLATLCIADEECAACCSGSPLAAAGAQSSSRPSQASDLTSEEEATMWQLLSDPAMVESPRLTVATSAAGSSGGTDRCSYDGAPMSPLLRSTASALRLANRRACRSSGMELHRSATVDSHFCFTPCAALATSLSADYRSVCRDAAAQTPSSNIASPASPLTTALPSLTESGSARPAAQHFRNPFDIVPELFDAAASMWK